MRCESLKDDSSYRYNSLLLELFLGGDDDRDVGLFGRRAE